jgi:triphosphatase
VEIELKLSLPQDALAALQRHPLLNGDGVEKCAPCRLVSTYFDTDDRALLKAGFGLRIRENDGQRVQTLKAAGVGSGAASFRNEWDWPVESNAPDLPIMGPVPGMADLLPHLETSLRPIFTTDFTRTAFIMTQDDAVIELAIDVGAIRSCRDEASGSGSILELELELKSGAAASLYHLALALMRTIPLRIETISKAERGYRMLDGSVPEPVKSNVPAFDLNMTGRDALQSLIGEGLHHLLANRAPTEAGDPEGLHQMRVALRRLRGVLMAFEPWLEPISTARFEDALKKLGQVMGDARDWDIFCLEVLPEALEAMPGSRRGVLLDDATKERNNANTKLLTILSESKINALLLSLNAWSAAPDQDNALDARLSELAPAMLERLARKVMKNGKKAFSGSDHELHRLRKSLKKLRYIVDDIGYLYNEKAVRAYLKPCKHLQAALGDFNDAATAAQLCTRLADDDRIDLLPMLQRVWDWSAQQKDRALRHAESVWDDFITADPFW